LIILISRNNREIGTRTCWQEYATLCSASAGSRTRKRRSTPREKRARMVIKRLKRAEENT
jgi:hypothetical protein